VARGRPAGGMELRERRLRGDEVRRKHGTVVESRGESGARKAPASFVSQVVVGAGNNPGRRATLSTTHHTSRWSPVEVLEPLIRRDR
jgi:hypothetical protein